MDGAWWLGIGMGAGVIGLHAAGRILAHYFSFQVSDQGAFLLLEMGGLGVRMFIVFGAVALVLLFVPVHPVAFVATVVVLLILGMIVETYWIARRMDRDSPAP
jgi:uncharacterized membrane protein YqjE